MRRRFEPQRGLGSENGGDDTSQTQQEATRCELVEQVYLLYYFKML